MHRSFPACTVTSATSPGAHQGVVVLEDPCPVEWPGGHAVVTLPEHIGISNAGQVREELLSIINRGATSLIADMTATVSCDHAGADAVARAYRRAVSSGMVLRLVVTAPVVSRTLSLSGLDRLVSAYPCLEAALAAVLPAAGAPGRDGAAGARALAGGRPGSLQDGVAVTDGDGTIAAASARLEDMFGYGHGELPGRPAGSLVPGGLRAARRRQHAAWMPPPGTRPAGAAAPPAGRRKDGTTFPVRVRLTSVTVAAGKFTLAVIRDITPPGLGEDPAGLAREAVTARQEHLESLGAVITGIFDAGLSLQAAMDLPAEAARPRIGAALADLDDIIREIRGTAFAPRGLLPRPAPSGDDR
jgi:anti-anti-sigma factor